MRTLSDDPVDLRAQGGGQAGRAATSGSLLYGRCAPRGVRAPSAEGAKQSFQFQSWPETAERLKQLGANTRLGIPGTVQERLRDVPVAVDQQPYRRRQTARGAGPGAPNVPGLRRGPINTWTEAAGTGAVIAIDPRTGEKQWKFEMTDVTSSGILTTASDLLFTGGREGYLLALDARTGELLWKASLGGQIANGPITYEVASTQFVAVAAGNSLFVFALRD